MALLERVATLLRANINDLIDRAEDPDGVDDQMVFRAQPPTIDWARARSLRAESHTNTNFTNPLTHRIGHDSVNAN